MPPLEEITFKMSKMEKALHKKFNSIPWLVRPQHWLECIRARACLRSNPVAHLIIVHVAICRFESGDVTIHLGGSKDMDNDSADPSQLQLDLADNNSVPSTPSKTTSTRAGRSGRKKFGDEGGSGGVKGSSGNGGGEGGSGAARDGARKELVLHYEEMVADCHIFTYLARSTGNSVLNRVRKDVFGIVLHVFANPLLTSTPRPPAHFSWTSLPSRLLL